MASRHAFRKFLSSSGGYLRQLQASTAARKSIIPPSITSDRCFHCSCYFNASKGKLKKPVDDVYLEELYEPKSYDLGEAITTLKRNTELDFTDQNSLVHLNLNLYLRPGKKGRLQLIHQTCDLPHDVDHSNKVCVFADDADTVKLALDNGAHMAGSNDIIPKILIAKEKCDAYITTPACLKSTLMVDRELAKTLKKMMPTKSRGTTENVLGSLLDLKDRTIISNLQGSGLEIKVIVAKIKQPFEEIKENILYAMEAVREQQNPKHPPIITGASVDCAFETITFEIEEESDLD